MTFKMKDPADEKVVEVEKDFSLDAVSIDDLKPIPTSVSVDGHPFSGYPVKKTKIGKGKGSFKVNLTSLVVLSPTVHIHQDPTMRHTRSKTTHSRYVKDHENGVFLSVVFDREITLEGDKKVLCAIVNSPSARALICFDKKGRPDKRYLLPDLDQVNRLRKLWKLIAKNESVAEREAESFDAAEESKG